MTSGDVLVVDDNPKNLELLESLLSQHGYRVRVASNGERALKTARAHPPELVLLDIMMPERDGYEVCQVLKSEPGTAGVPVIFISALDEPLDKVRAFGVGGIDYVTKPFNGEEVLARVGSQVRLVRFQREVELRNAELKKAYEQLRTAQEQIDRLSQPSAERFEDTAAWAAAMTAEVIRAVGAREIGVWAVEGERLVPLAAGSTAPPESVRLRSGVRFTDENGSTVVPVVGMTGAPRGALVIDAPTAAWDETQWRVLAALAHHVGSALDLRWLRDQLTASEASRAATRRALHERGVETLLVCPRCGLCFAEPARTEEAAAATICPADGAELTAGRVLPFRVGGRYALHRRLGEGGMGIVFAARDEVLSRDVALKIVRPEHLSDPAMRFRLEREARAIAGIQHPGVAVLYDTAEMEDGSAYLVMELLKGRVLSSLLDELGPGTFRQIARLLRQAAAALAAAHRVGVIHRDVKPDNIFLVAEAAGFQTKLLDFGAALSTRIDTRLTQAGLVIGTPAYMSPEQVQGLEVDERADLYSLACVAWEALVGRPLVKGSGSGTTGYIADVMMKVVYEPPTPVSRFLPGIAAGVDELFDAALAKSPLERPEDIESWAESLAALLEGRDDDGRAGWPSRAWGEGTGSAPPGGA